MQRTKQQILDFLQHQHVGVISSIDSTGAPNSATVYFIADDNLHIYFPTRNGSRKYTNIQADTRVAFTTTEVDEMRTVQLTGTAEEVSDPAKIIGMIEKLLSVSSHHVSSVGKWIPPIQQLRNGHFALLKITPDWMRFGEFSENGVRSDSDNYTVVIGE